jgi:hypothetical protein
MSTLTVPTPAAEDWPRQAADSRAAVQTAPVAAAPAFIRRRPSREQGMALEKLGHAIEYLIDSSMSQCGKGMVADPRSPEFQAVRIMMQLNCEVFADCEPVLPLRERILGSFGLGRRMIKSAKA